MEERTLNCFIKMLLPSFSDVWYECWGLFATQMTGLYRLAKFFGWVCTWNKENVKKVVDDKANSFETQTFPSDLNGNFLRNFETHFSQRNSKPLNPLHDALYSSFQILPSVFNRYDPLFSHITDYIILYDPITNRTDIFHALILVRICNNNSCHIAMPRFQFNNSKTSAE